MQDRSLINSRKGKFLGLLLAILLTMSSYALTTWQHNVFDEFDTEVPSWDFSSGLTLSSQIEGAASTILALTFRAYTVQARVDDLNDYNCWQSSDWEPVSTFHCDGYSVTEPYNFNNQSQDRTEDINSLFIYYKSETTQINYFLDTIEGELVTSIPIQSHYQKEISLTQSQVYPLVNSFSYDIKPVQNISQITPEDVQTIRKGLVSGDNMWEVKLIFADGSMIRLHYYGNQVIIQQFQLQEYIVSPHGGFKFGPIYSDNEYPSYHGIVDEDELLPHFIAQIFDFYGEILHG